MIQEIQEKLAYLGMEIGHIFPNQCADEAVILSSYLSSLNVHRATKRQIAYKVALNAKQNGKSASEAEITMKASDEYREYQIIDGLCDAVVEVSHSLKIKVRTLEKEEKTI